MAKRHKPHEDKTIYSIAKTDTIKAQDEFQGGDYICYCHECGAQFIGYAESYFCIKCINEFY